MGAADCGRAAARVRIRNRGGLKNVAIKMAGSVLTETGQGWVVCVYWVVQSVI